MSEQFDLERIIEDLTDAREVWRNKAMSYLNRDVFNDYDMETRDEIAGAYQRCADDILRIQISYKTKP